MDSILSWFALPFEKQMLNIGSEVSRALRWKNAGNREREVNAAIKAVEIFGLTKMDPKHAKRFLELHDYELTLMDYLFGENERGNTDESIMALYNQFWQDADE